MKLARNQLKEKLAIAKRLIGKTKNHIVCQSFGDGILHIEAKMETQGFIYSTTIPLEDEDVVSFSIDPHQWFLWCDTKKTPEIKDFLKVTFAVEGNKLVFKEPNITKKLAIVPYDGSPIAYQPEHLQPLHDSEWFLAVLKQATTILKNNTSEETVYLKITNEKTLVVEEKQIQSFRIQEDFPFKGTHLHKDLVAVLATSFDKTIAHTMDKKDLIFENEGNVFRIKPHPRAPFPDLRQMSKKEDTYTFFIHAPAVIKACSAFKKGDTPFIGITAENGHLLFDPRNEEFDVTSVPYQRDEGEMKKELFECESLRNFFSGYSGDVRVVRKLCQNVYGDIGPVWEIYDKEGTSLVAALIEPSFDEIRKKHQNGEYNIQLKR